MALNMDFPLRGGVVAQHAYLMAHRITRDRLTGQIVGQIWVYGSEKARRRAEDLLRGHRTNLKALTDATTAVETIGSEKLTFPKWEPDKSWTVVEAQLALDTHNAEVKRIQDEYDARYKPLVEAAEKARSAAVASERALGEPDAKPVQAFAFEIPPDQADDMADLNGNADTPKVYAWLKRQPRFAGATDA